MNDEVKIAARLRAEAARIDTVLGEAKYLHRSRVKRLKKIRRAIAYGLSRFYDEDDFPDEGMAG
jgi:hypothetical protein